LGLKSFYHGWKYPNPQRLAAKRRIGVIGRGGSVRGGYSRRDDRLGLRVKSRRGEIGRLRKKGPRAYGRL
jgi:hypothetical protein